MNPKDVTAETIKHVESLVGGPVSKRQIQQALSKYGHWQFDALQREYALARQGAYLMTTAALRNETLRGLRSMEVALAARTDPEDWKRWRAAVAVDKELYDAIQRLTHAAFLATDSWEETPKEILAGLMYTVHALSNRSRSSWPPGSPIVKFLEKHLQAHDLVHCFYLVEEEDQGETV